MSPSLSYGFPRVLDFGGDETHQASVQHAVDILDGEGSPASMAAQLDDQSNDVFYPYGVGSFGGWTKNEVLQNPSHTAEFIAQHVEPVSDILHIASAPTNNGHEIIHSHYSFNPTSSLLVSPAVANTEYDATLDSMAYSDVGTSGTSPSAKGHSITAPWTVNTLHVPTTLPVASMELHTSLPVPGGHALPLQSISDAAEFASPTPLGFPTPPWTPTSLTPPYYLANLTDSTSSSVTDVEFLGDVGSASTLNSDGNGGHVKVVRPSHVSTPIRKRARQVKSLKSSGNV